MIKSVLLPGVAACTFLGSVQGASANPAGGNVVAGSATIHQAGNTLTVNQATQNAIINWNSFSIANGEHTRFNQPGVNSAVLNRVLGGNPSAIYGSLSSNGKVFLINPNGIIVGPNGIINAGGGFVGSTLDIPDSAFLSGGDLSFAGEAITSIVNYGTIQSAQGDVALIGFTVENSGAIGSPNGKTFLGAGRNILLKAKGDDRLYVQSSLTSDDQTAQTGIDQKGVITAASAELKAAGNNLYALAVNNEGVIEATGVELIDGRIVLTSEDGNIDVGGRLSAKQVNGDGGEVLIGGEYQGNAPDRIANAQNVFVAADAQIDVSAASKTGNGGRTIVWGDNATAFYGQIDGRGGSTSGNGAFAEVSGKSFLDYQGVANLTAANGHVGTLLLDPTNVEITNSVAEQNNTSSTSFGVTTLGSNAISPTVLSTNTVETALAGADVKISTNSAGGENGDITVSSALSWASNNNLIFDADNSIIINANITATGGTANINLYDSDNATRGAGNITTASGATLQANEVNIATAGNATFNGAINATTFRVNSLGVGGALTATNAANTIGQLSFASNAQMTGDVNIYDSAGGLSVFFSQLNTTGAVTLRTVGNLSIAANHSITAGGNIVLQASGGTFTANNPVTLTAPRYLIYANTLEAGNLTPTVSKANYSNDPLGSGNVFYAACTTDCATSTTKTETDAFGTDGSADKETTKNSTGTNTQVVTLDLGDAKVDKDNGETEIPPSLELEGDVFVDLSTDIINFDQDKDPLANATVGGGAIPGIQAVTYNGLNIPLGAEPLMDKFADSAFKTWKKNNPKGTRRKFNRLMRNGDPEIQGQILSAMMTTWTVLKGIPADKLPPEHQAFRQGLTQFIAMKKRQMATAAQEEYQRLQDIGSSNLTGVFRRSFPDIASIVSGNLPINDPAYSEKLAGILSGTVGASMLTGGAVGAFAASGAASVAAAGTKLAVDMTLLEAGGSTTTATTGSGLTGSMVAGPAAIVTVAILIGIKGGIDLAADTANEEAYENLLQQARGSIDLLAMDNSEMASWITMMMVNG